METILVPYSRRLKEISSTDSEQKQKEQSKQIELIEGDFG